MADPKQKSTLTLAQIDEALKRILGGEIASVNGINPNLLDTWYFGRPVNQKGQTEYAVNGYTVDRWFSNYANLKVELVNGGIKVANTGTVACALRQPFENKPVLSVHTASVLCEAVTGTVYLQNFYADGTTSSALKLADGLVCGTEGKSTGFDRFSFYFTAGASVILKAAKLELGSQQTLAHQDENGNWVLNEIPDYGEQLLKCQRYYQLFSSADARPSDLADYRPSMRANPAVGTIDIGGKTYYFADANL